MTAKHTPGPWTYHATAGEHDCLIYPESGGPDVALVRNFDEHNARLVAAAPELLEALQWIAEHGAEFGDIEDAETQLARIEQRARKAIRKALEG